MITAWTKHLKDPQEIAKFERQLENAYSVLERQTEILKESLDQLENVETNLSEYDSPSWSYKQAHRNGQRSALKNILRLINLDNKEHT